MTGSSLEILRLTNTMNSYTNFIHNIPIQNFLIEDFRNKTPKELLERKLITRSAFDTLIRGRKWHKELPSTGAVGLLQSVRKALNSSSSNYTMIFEEDNQCNAAYIKNQIF